MTLDDLAGIEAQIEALGVEAPVMMMSRKTAEDICGGPDLSPLYGFAERHGLTFILSRKAPNGIIYRSDARE